MVLMTCSVALSAQTQGEAGAPGQGHMLELDTGLPEQADQPCHPTAARESCTGSQHLLGSDIVFTWAFF